METPEIQQTTGSEQSMPNIENGLTSDTINAIIKKLDQQNQLLQSIEKNIGRSLEQDGKKIFKSTKIHDFNMSIGSMIELSFKWLVASIPIGIVVLILWAIISAIASAASY